jgi:hypothetical protein
MLVIGFDWINSDIAITSFLDVDAIDYRDLTTFAQRAMSYT